MFLSFVIKKKNGRITFTCFEAKVYHSCRACFKSCKICCVYTLRVYHFILKKCDFCIYMVSSRISFKNVLLIFNKRSHLLVIVCVSGFTLKSTMLVLKIFYYQSRFILLQISIHIFCFSINYKLTTPKKYSNCFIQNITFIFHNKIPFQISLDFLCILRITIRYRWRNSMLTKDKFIFDFHGLHVLT